MSPSLVSNLTLDGADVWRLLFVKTTLASPYSRAVFRTSGNSLFTNTKCERWLSLKWLSRSSGDFVYGPVPTPALHQIQSNRESCLDRVSESESTTLMLRTENVIGRAVRLSRARADRDFTGSVGPGPSDQDLTSIPGRVRSEAFKMSVGSV